MKIKKITLNSARALSLTLVASGVFGVNKAYQAQDPAMRIACDVMATQAQQNGTDYKPNLVCRLAARIT